VEIDFLSYSGCPAATMSADALLARVRPLFTGLAATQHSMTNPQVDVDGDRTTRRMCMQAEHVLDPPSGSPSAASTPTGRSTPDDGGSRP